MKTLLEFATEYARRTGGTVTFVCPAYAVVEGGSHPRHLPGPTSGRDWAEECRAALESSR